MNVIRIESGGGTVAPSPSILLEKKWKVHVLDYVSATVADLVKFVN